MARRYRSLPKGLVHYISYLLGLPHEEVDLGEVIPLENDPVCDDTAVIGWVPIAPSRLGAQYADLEDALREINTYGARRAAPDLFR